MFLLGITELKCVWLLFLQIATSSNRYNYVLLYSYHKWDNRTHITNGIMEAEKFFNDLFKVTRWSEFLLSRVSYRIPFWDICHIWLEALWFRKILIALLDIYKAFNIFKAVSCTPVCHHPHISANQLGRGSSTYQDRWGDSGIKDNTIGFHLYAETKNKKIYKVESDSWI